jgi:3',5'-cyclic AMP phosphodiesterase CpdA
MPITWLHISDLHRGQPGDQRWSLSSKLILEDIKEKVADSSIGPPDLILFTGDLAYAGRRNDYDRVDETINEIYGCLQMTRS